jgi:hypothetical protein
MRISLILAGAAAATLVAGCQSEAQIRQSVRDEIVRSCNSQSAQLPGLDAARFCNCLADRSLQGRTLDDLRRWGEDKQAATKAGEQAGLQCAQEQLGAAAGGAPQAQNAASEATAEGGDEAE